MRSRTSVREKGGKERRHMEAGDGKNLG